MHRWTVALLAALLVGSSVALVLGLAVAQGLGQSVEAPPRLVGDRALYTVRDGNGTVVGELRVEALAPMAQRGADGGWQAVAPLRQAFVPDADAVADPEDPNERAETIVEPWQAPDGTTLAVRVAGGNESHLLWETRYNSVNVILPSSAAEPNVFIAPQAVLYGDLPAGEGGWCGLRHAAQGRQLPVRAGLVAPDCPGGSLEWLGRVGPDGEAAHLFGAGDDRVWVAPGWTYPVRIETARLEGARSLELVGFEAGGLPIDLGDVALPAAGAVPAIAFAPRTATGPDATGVDHPFTIPQALEQARRVVDRPLVPFSDPALGEFLMAHPDAQVVEAHYSEHSDTDWVVRSWELALVDGDASAVGTVSMEHKEPNASPLAPPFWSMLSPYRGNALVSGEGPEGPWPDPSLWPSEMPTVASVMARWEAVRDPAFDGKAPTGWSFRIGCADEACTAPEVEVAAGHLRFQQPPEPLVSGTVTPPQGPAVEADSQALAVDGEGRSRALASVHRVEAPEDRGSLLTLPGATAASVAARPGPAWDLPPAAAITTGAFALAAGLAVLLWPALKSAATGAGGAGLFSRIEGPRLLEHRGRAALVQAIEAEPGVHLRELARRTGIAEGALRHHLRKLEDAGLILGRPLGGYLCYFLPAAATAAGAGTAAAARSDGARKVLAAIEGGATGVRAIAAATGLAPSTVSHHLGRLREAGAVPAGAEAAGGDETPR